jgi:hypothetical protein
MNNDNVIHVNFVKPSMAASFEIPQIMKDAVQKLKALPAKWKAVRTSVKWFIVSVMLVLIGLLLPATLLVSSSSATALSVLMKMYYVGAGASLFGVVTGNAVSLFVGFLSSMIGAVGTTAVTSAMSVAVSKMVMIKTSLCVMSVATSVYSAWLSARGR